MQPVPPYRPENYPPHGGQWPRFGDPQLDQALASISAEAHAALLKKRAMDQPMHMDRLQYHGLAPKAAPMPIEPPVAEPEQPMGMPEQPTETPSDPAYMSIGDEEGASQPSGIRRMASGIGNIVSNYMYPATRDIIAPAMADAAVHGAKGLIWLTAKSAWTAAQLFWVLSGGEGAFPESVGDSSSSGQQALTYDPDAADADEVERLSKKGKGFLVEELYRTEGWRKVFQQEDAKGYANDESVLFRKQLGKMSKRDLAEVLVKLNKNR